MDALARKDGAFRVDRGLPVENPLVPPSNHIPIRITAGGRGRSRLSHGERNGGDLDFSGRRREVLDGHFPRARGRGLVDTVGCDHLRVDTVAAASNAVGKYLKRGSLHACAVTKPGDFIADRIPLGVAGFGHEGDPGSCVGFLGNEMGVQEDGSAILH
jgi:hypothetical protein